MRDPAPLPAGTTALSMPRDAARAWPEGADLALLIGRILLVAIFPISGYYKLIGWPGIVTTLTQAGAPLPMAGGVVALAAELLLPVLVVLGIGTRWAMIGLILYTLGTSVIAHRFWEFAPPQQFGQIMQFMKNLSMIGGMAVVAAVGPGRYALRPS